MSQATTTQIFRIDIWLGNVKNPAYHIAHIFVQCFGYVDLSFSCIDVSKNSGTPKLSILIGIFIINHPFWGTTIFGNTRIDMQLFFFGGVCMFFKDLCYEVNFTSDLPPYHLWSFLEPRR